MPGRELCRACNRNWDMGRMVIERQQGTHWGAAVVERVSRDIRSEFPGIKGFSVRNIWLMRTFYRAWAPMLQRPVAALDGKSILPALSELPWGHNITLLEKLRDPGERLWYARQAMECGWSRYVLVHQIESGLYRRQGKAPTGAQRRIGFRR